MIFNLLYLFLLFLIYSFCGYICEIVYSSIYQKKLVNRGFFCGPYCPIYGVGSLFILFTLLRFKSSPVIVYLLGALITSALEYATSFILEKIFHNKWWDYSTEKYNINGRICLLNSLLFGLGTLVIIYIGDPITTKLLSSLSTKTIYLVGASFLSIFLIDCIYSIIIAYNLRNRIIICEELKHEKLAKIPGMLEKIIKDKVANLPTYPKRLLDAFPYLKVGKTKEFDIMKKIRDKKISKDHKSINKKVKSK